MLPNLDPTHYMQSQNNNSFYSFNFLQTLSNNTSEFLNQLKDFHTEILIKTSHTFHKSSN